MVGHWVVMRSEGGLRRRSEGGLRRRFEGGLRRCERDLRSK